MAYRLSNQSNPELAIRLSHPAWHALLDLAEEFGWNPLGTLAPDWWVGPADNPDDVGLEYVDFWQGSYTPDHNRLVVVDDALNLSDALKRAFVEFEPEKVHSYAELSLAGPDRPDGQRPAIGAILMAAEFCEQGAFWIESDELISRSL